MTNDILLAKADQLKAAVSTLNDFDAKCAILVQEFGESLDLSYLGSTAPPSDKLPAIRRALLHIIAQLGDDIQKGAKL